MDLLKHDPHAPTIEFVITLSPYMFLPHIVQPTRETRNSETLNYNIFSNILGSDSFSGNLAATVSDHLSQLFIASVIFSISTSGSKSNIGLTLSKEILFLTI